VIAGLGLAAILCHSFFYNAFFEDPMMWGLVGLLALASRVPARRPEPDATVVEHKEAVPV
jgi:hypothetical protein